MPISFYRPNTYILWRTLNSLLIKHLWPTFLELNYHFNLFFSFSKTHYLWLNRILNNWHTKAGEIITTKPSQHVIDRTFLWWLFIIQLLRISVKLWNQCSILLKKFLKIAYNSHFLSPGNFWARKSSNFYRTVGGTIGQSLNSSFSSFQQVVHKESKIGCLIAKISWATKCSNSTSATGNPYICAKEQ